MLKFFSRQKSVRNDTVPAADLLDHPDIARMDTRELGDLPFPRTFVTDHDAEAGRPAGPAVQAKASVTLISPTNRPFQLCMA